MTVHGTFGSLIYSVVYIGCTLLFLLPELVICLEYLEDGEKQVSDLALNLNELPYRRFEVLKPSMDCKFSNLTRCHVNPDKFYDYQERCFKYLCQHNEQYRCLNGPKNRTIHICLPLEECQKRSRDIATYETAGSGHVNVYRIDCPAGYFQSSLRNCFDKCDKDESLVIVINATGQKPAIGYCNSQKGYCNRKNVFMFEVGSTEDECIHAKLDMKIQCDAEEELLPNCSCVYKCQRGEKRDWSEAFICRSTGTSVRNHVSTEDVTEVPTTASQQTSYQTSQKVITGMHILDDELSVKDDMKQNTDDLQSSKTIVTVGAELIGVIAGMCAFASIVVGLVMYYKYRHQGRGMTFNGIILIQEYSPLLREVESFYGIVFSE
ncbi:uncharacterized protein LOC123538816 isoform X2 [Mercenaria mercenaria]|nr:uncharacterized protein LOC123538816 isoform X2 [Mercenaria mercenaria]